MNKRTHSRKFHRLTVVIVGIALYLLVCVIFRFWSVSIIEIGFGYQNTTRATLLGIGYERVGPYVYPIFTSPKLVLRLFNATKNGVGEEYDCGSYIMTTDMSTLTIKGPEGSFRLLHQACSRKRAHILPNGADASDIMRVTSGGVFR